MYLFSAPFPVQQPEEAPDTQGVPGSESGVTAAPVVLTVESKSLQTEDTETVQVSNLHHLSCTFHHFLFSFTTWWICFSYGVTERNGYSPKRPQCYPESHERAAERQVVSL